MNTLERDALYQAVVENPRDEGPRLIAADWYDDNGEPERAEVIRAGVEVQRFLRLVEVGQPMPQEPYHRSLERERKAWVAAGSKGYGWIPGILTTLFPEARSQGYSDPWLWEDKRSQYAFAFLGGFIGEISCSEAVWLLPDVGPILVKTLPIERVRINDKEPYLGGEITAEGASRTQDLREPPPPPEYESGMRYWFCQVPGESAQLRHWIDPRLFWRLKSGSLANPQYDRMYRRIYASHRDPACDLSLAAIDWAHHPEVEVGPPKVPLLIRPEDFPPKEPGRPSRSTPRATRRPSLRAPGT